MWLYRLRFLASGKVIDAFRSFFMIAGFVSFAFLIIFFSFFVFGFLTFPVILFSCPSLLRYTKEQEDGIWHPYYS